MSSHSLSCSIAFLSNPMLSSSSTSSSIFLFSTVKQWPSGGRLVTKIRMDSDGYENFKELLENPVTDAQVR
jgi:hypothetical protein